MKDVKSGSGVEDKIALVFGAASGIGKAVAQRFEAEGAQVVGCDVQPRRNPDSSANVVRVCDVTDEAQVRAAVDAAIAEYGRVDVLINAAGIIRNDDVAGIKDAVWNQTMDVNLTGTMRTMRAVLPGMLRRKSGAIVNIASVAAFNSGADVASYAASKAAVVALTRSAAQRYGSLGIRINAVCPGWVDTPMSAREMMDMASALGISVEQAIERTLQRVCLGRMAAPSEIAAVCLFLAGDDASFVTGIALVADGGMRVAAASRAI
jgi:NAD(P)-dependent dehydrogenase (short-subunit alcohol dehydrogenase family)